MDSGTQGSRLPAAGHLKRRPEIRNFPVDSMCYRLGKVPELGGLQSADRNHQAHGTYKRYMGVNGLIGSDRQYIDQMDYSTKHQKAELSSIKKAMKCNVTLWRVRLTIATIETQQCMYIVELHVTVSNINVLNVAHRCFNGKCMPPATIK